MKVSYSWLQEYVKLAGDREAVAEMLTGSGTEVTSREERGDDIIFDLEVTPNRPDCLSHVGIAREVAALTGNKLQLPRFKLQEGKEEASHFASVRIEDAELSPRYTARVIRGVKVGESPSWLRQRLEAVGLKAVNNVVDATNYVLQEEGHPLHAFDCDRLEEGKILVRLARPGEKILTLDGEMRELSPDMLVIADAKRPVALAGIMGGGESEVKPDTCNVLLECACFAPGSIRRTARRLQVMTEASYRFERGTSPENLPVVLDRTAQLIQEVAGGSIARGMIDCYPGKKPRPPISLRTRRVNQILGARMGATEIRKDLTRLGFSLSPGAKKGTFKVTVPSFRLDVEREIDLVEEVARLYGYGRIPSTLPRIQGVAGERSRESVTCEAIRRVLVSCGLREIISYSFLCKKDLENCNIAYTSGEVVSILNPLSEEHELLRPTLLAGILRILAGNWNRGQRIARVFELGKVFGAKDQEGVPGERLTLAGGIYGPGAEPSWSRKETVFDFFDLKGMVESLFREVDIGPAIFVAEENPVLVPGRTAALEIEGRRVGVMGEARSEVREALGLEPRTYLFEFDLEALFEKLPARRKMMHVPRYPGSYRDISLIVPEEVSSQELETAMREAGAGLLVSVELFDLYLGDQVPSGHKSLAYSLTYRAETRTLTDEEVNRCHTGIEAALEEKLGARLRT